LVFHATQVGPWTLEWQVVVGLAALLLLLTGVALFALAAIRRRRSGATPAVPDEKAA
jgi:glucose uptake protein GlcU